MRDRAGLDVFADSHVERIVIRDGRAVGVVVDGEELRAERVILAAGAAGAVGTSAILWRPGSARLPSCAGWASRSAWTCPGPAHHFPELRKDADGSIVFGAWRWPGALTRARERHPTVGGPVRTAPHRPGIPVDERAYPLMAEAVRSCWELATTPAILEHGTRVVMVNEQAWPPRRGCGPASTPP